MAPLLAGLAVLGCAPGPPARSVPPAPPAPPPARRWVLYVRPTASGQWRRTGRTFPSAEACLRVSDRLNNADPRHIYDCDELPPGPRPPRGTARRGLSRRPRHGA